MSAPGGTSYRFGPFRLDRGERLLYCDGQPIGLTPKAVDTLLVLVERHGRLVSKEELLEEVWRDAYVEENNLAQHISMLRRALARGGEGPFIETVPKRGYRFVAPVEEQETVVPVPPVAAARPPVASVASSDPPAVLPAPQARRRWNWAAAIAILLIAVAIGFAWSSRRSGPSPDVAGADSSAGSVVRIAVLPFLNPGSPAGDYLSAGTTEELTSRLAMLRPLGVISSTSTREYDRRGKTTRTIGADLGAAYVVEGSVRLVEGDASRVRIIPRLIRAADDMTVWTHQYDAALSDMASVHADIARQVGSALKVVGDDKAPHPPSRPTADPEAYLSYLKGIAAYQHSFSDTSQQVVARRELEHAVARDPQFAMAWSWLAHVYASQYISGAQRSPEVRDAADRAARRAIELSPALPEARLGLAQLLMLRREYEAALREIDAAREARPNSPDLLRMAALIQQRRGLWGESFDLYMRAFDLDPAGSADLIAIHYLHMRQYDQARRFIALAKAANRSGAVVPEAWLEFSDTGRIDPVRRLLEPALSMRSPADARVRGLLATMELFDGRYERSLALIADMDGSGAWWPANFRFPAAIAAGRVYDSLGDRPRAADHYASALAQLRLRARANPDDFQVEAAMGLAAAGLGRADEAVRHATRAVELLPVTRDAAHGPLYLYTLALVHARLGQHVEAVRTLDKLFSVPGFYNERWLQRDPWFATLREDPAFTAHLARWSRLKGDAIPALAGNKPR